MRKVRKLAMFVRYVWHLIWCMTFWKPPKREKEVDGEC